MPIMGLTVAALDAERDWRNRRPGAFREAGKGE
jgi:hypothetical protein